MHKSPLPVPGRPAPADHPDHIVIDPYAVGWAVIGGVAMAYEVIALSAGHPEHTLSAYVRRGLGLEPRQLWWRGGAAALALGLAWVGVHVGFGILPRAPRALPMQQLQGSPTPWR